MTYGVYILSDPRTDQIRYVGKTTGSLQKRLKQHLSASSLRWKSHKNHWVKELTVLGLRPLIEEAEVFDSQKAMDEGEKFYISYFKSLGFKLTNSTDGGEGLSPGFKHTAETKTKMQASHAGKKKAPFSAEHKRNIAIARARQVCTSETRAKMSAAHTGKKHSEDTKAKMSRAALGKKKSENHRVALSVSCLGRKISLETKSKMSMSQKARQAANKTNRASARRKTENE